MMTTSTTPPTSAGNTIPDDRHSNQKCAAAGFANALRRVGAAIGDPAEERLGSMCAACAASSKPSHVAPRQQKRERRQRPQQAPARTTSERHGGGGVGGNDGSTPTAKSGDRDDAEHEQSQRPGAFERPERPQVEHDERGEQDGDERRARGSAPGQRLHPQQIQELDRRDSREHRNRTRRSDVTGSVNSRRGNRPTPLPPLDSV